MKFGKYLEENYVPEWRDRYIQYKRMRKMIKKFKVELDQFKNGDYDDDRSTPTSAPSRQETTSSSTTTNLDENSNTHAPTLPQTPSLRRNLSMRFTSALTSGSDNHSPLRPSSATTYANLVKRSGLGGTTGVNTPFMGDQSQGLSIDSVTNGDLQMAFANALANSTGVNKPKPVFPLHSQHVVQRLIEIQSDIVEQVMDEAKKINEFYVEREKEAIERFNKIYSQVHHLIKQRNEEKIEMESSPPSSPRGASGTNGGVAGNGDTSSSGDEKNTVVITIPDNDNNQAEQASDRTHSSSTKEDKKHLLTGGDDDSDSSGDENNDNINADGDSNGQDAVIEMTEVRTGNVMLDKLLVTIEQDMLQPLNIKAKKWLKLGKKKKSKDNESVIKELLQEFYRYLILLKNYKVINYTGLVKIIKKAEKNTDLVLNAKMIDTINGYQFKTSKLVDKLSGSVEKLYSDVFCHGKLRDARKNLRHKQAVEQTKGATTSSTFFTGMCAGWTSAILLLIYFVLYTGEYSDFVRFSVVYNLFVTLGLTILWALMFGINIYIWTKTHVHYSFIFELSKNTLTYHKVFQAVTVLSVLWITFIGIYMWKSMGEFPFPWVPPEFTPLVLFIIYILILICPFNIFQLEIRKWFLITIWRVVTAPLKSVKFAHFFMGDQLSSLVLMMVQMSQFICFYSVDAYHPPDDSICPQKGRYINPFISGLPAFWRLMQCFRRYKDSKDKVHLKNALKYFLSIVVVFFSAMDSFYSHGWSSPTRIIWLISGLVNSSYSYWWDLFMDWSILVKPKTSTWNPFKYTLRKKRMYNPTFVYYIAIGTNFIFRMTWSLTKSLAQLTFILPSYKLVVIIAILEVLRRGQWNVYRLENEHINNCGRFRATRDIPLPYEIDS
ncbi:hypothetical protein SAMD00019534_112180 [Acytostelium subglobosum LB1]|uniref:hypothetical protein n=1 Tax=Acytostelium subglobosum LB1 TaxID=1410327 RepID=UPI000644ED61|nr:hypothetical protein SAMD00019534_112180 [Acytostelium subglobosum LB1]GAM28042.1 hypothetical protein SAMD00019534_112180 [Acytostelium subglobosum LB1]|eukprot:XP_012749001.1 hypothetical protein SAMD00019534_112180 [Acytostelium subglobosum LB1]